MSAAPPGPFLEPGFPNGPSFDADVPFRDREAGIGMGSAMNLMSATLRTAMVPGDAATPRPAPRSAGAGAVSVPLWRPPAHAPAPVAGERRAGLRRPPLVTADGVRVEALSFDVAALHREAWLHLAEHSVEPNPFLDPDFALAAARHLPAARRPLFVVARGLVGGRMRMMGLLALDPGRRLFTGVAAAWEHPYAALGAPLLGTARAAEALEGLLAWTGAHLSGAGALLMPDLPRDGAVVQLLRRAAMAHGRQFRLLDPRARAVARVGEGRAAPAPSREMKRLWRRLGEAGALETHVVADPVEVRNGFEQFLALEAAGWKGARGTAMICEAGAAAFARSAVRMMATRGAARLVALTLDGRAIAIGVVLIAGGTAAFWKIAHDPAFGKFSPGAQLSLRLAEIAAADPAIAFVDSCAVENHSMIDRLWPERVTIADAALSLPTGRAGHGAFRSSLARETARRGARGLAKRAFLAVTGRKKV